MNVPTRILPKTAAHLENQQQFQNTTHFPTNNTAGDSAIDATLFHEKAIGGMTTTTSTTAITATLNTIGNDQPSLVSLQSSCETAVQEISTGLINDDNTNINAAVSNYDPDEDLLEYADDLVDFAYFLSGLSSTNDHPVATNTQTLFQENPTPPCVKTQAYPQEGVMR